VTLRRLVLTYPNGGFEIRVLYKTPNGLGPSTQACLQEVTGLVRTGLAQALEALNSEAGAEGSLVGTSGFTRREDVLSLEAEPERKAPGG
jgi:hypothetical protein